jgi:hypothetical protein
MPKKRHSRLVNTLPAGSGESRGAIIAGTNIVALKNSSMPVKDSGATPMTVKSRPFRRIIFPSILGSAAN